MSDTPRIKDLRRRADRDPASIVFAALAEEYRRAGRLEEAIATCRAGLEHHPAFLSARVTLGRALIEGGELGEAKEALEYVVNAAPENLAAIRALAEIHSRQGELDEEKVYSAMAEFVVAEPGLHEAPHRPRTAAPAATPVGVAAAEPVKPPTQSDPPVVVVERGFQEAPFRPTTDAPATKPVGVAAAEPVRPPTQSDPLVVVVERGFQEAPFRPTTDAPATRPVGVAAAEPVRPPTPSDPPVVVVERGFQEAPFRPTTDAPAAEPVRVAAAKPVRPPTPSLPPGVSSADTDSLRALEGLLVAVLGARAQRERASPS